MSASLLDVTVLIALLDADHVDHHRARAWLAEEIHDGWASCAITQNGFVRIISQPRYPSPVSPTQAIDLLEQATLTEHHHYWPCSVSIVGDDILDRSHLHGPRQVSDAYLLALATEHEGRFVTLDESVPLSAVRRANAANLVVI